MKVEEIELLRKKSIKCVVKCVLVTVILSVLIGVITTNFLLIPIVLFVGFIVTITKRQIIINELKEKFKKTCIEKSLSQVFSDLTYEPYPNKLPFQIDSNIEIYHGDQLYVEDLILGKYKNINLVHADLYTKELVSYSDRDGKTYSSWETAFRGRWMMFDFNKNFKYSIIVVQDKFPSSRATESISAEDYVKIQVEDMQFNNQFKIYTQSGHDAFYVLTPSLIEKIKKMSNLIDGKLLLYFNNNKLHVGIHNNKGSFEINTFKKIDEQEVMSKILKDIKCITDFIDELDLENDLFDGEA